MTLKLFSHRLTQMHTDELTTTAIEVELLMTFGNEPTIKPLMYNKQPKNPFNLC